MRWLIDECVDAAVAARLREAGQDVVYVAEVASRSVDTEIISRAHDENRVLLTEDKDFGDLVFRQGMPVPGVVLLRVDPQQRSLKAVRLLIAVDKFADALLGHYTVIEATRFRSRPLHR